MKHCYFLYLLMVTFLLSSLVQAQQVTNQFTNYAMGGPHSAEFTTNNFKCIGVGKGNLKWAGTQYGGLYMYNDSFNIWRKSTKLTNVFINDIKPDPDSGIWIAQSGTQTSGGNSNIGGGVNYFPVASDISMEFYSVAGTTTAAHLVSRNARSLYVDQSKTAAAGDLPRPWVAQGTYITSFNTNKGGLSVGLNPYWPHFTEIKTGFLNTTNATPFAECIGGNSKEVWVYTRQNGTPATKILRYRPDGSYIAFFSHLNVPVFANGFIAQAIYFDGFGNQWVGLRQGGLRIRKPDTSWVSFDPISYFSAGTQVNINAITEDEFGNVYIGTNEGLLQYESPIYNPLSSPDYLPSYKRFTTFEGLPSNNITGLAYDKKNGNLLITTDAGVSFMKRREPYIKGVVFDVYTNIQKPGNPNPGLQKRPLSGGVTVTLLKNGVEEETTTPNAFGIFELKEANDIDDYTVEIRNTNGERPVTYVYNNVKNHTLMQPVLIPDSLIQEIQVFEDSLRRRCFPVELAFGLPISELFCVDGFQMNGYATPIEPFYAAGGITTDHTRRVENLANYYASLATVYKLGGNATELYIAALNNLFDGVESLASLAEMGLKAKKGVDTLPVMKQVGKGVDDFMLASIKLLKEGLVKGLEAAASQLPENSDARGFCTKSIVVLNEFANFALEAQENGVDGGVLKFLKDNLKKVAAQAIAINDYRDGYARERHLNFVQNQSNAASNLASDFTYEQTYDNLYNPNAESLAKHATDTLNNVTANLKTLKNIADYADYAATAADGAAVFAIGAAPAALALKLLSGAAKATKSAAFFKAMYEGGKGSNEIADISDKISQKSGLQRKGNNPAEIAARVNQFADPLVNFKSTYLQTIHELQSYYALNSFDSTAYKTKFTAFQNADSVLSVELLKTMNMIASTADSSRKVPGFSSRYNVVVDSFLAQQAVIRQSMFLENLAYVITPDKHLYIAGLDSVCVQLKLLTDSTVNGIAQLANIITTNNVLSRAFLEQDGYTTNHNRVPGTSGTISYRFTNYGGVPQNNVSFKIDQPTGGYTITSLDSIYAGTILPGQSFTITYHYTAPLQDSIGSFTIHVKADNGYYKDVYGGFYVLYPGKMYSIKAGNWHDPATWSTNSIPTAANPVYIYHHVNVTDNAVCKSATLSHPGNVSVATGKVLEVKE